MSADDSPRTSSSKLASGGRSILSRLTSPLRSRARNVADFHIRASEPHRQYSPGDVVKGLVVLTVVKPIRITHLTVALLGFVRVLKSPAAAGETITSEPIVAVTNTRRSQYTGNGHASLFQDEITLCGEGRLEPGIYEFEFNLQFPNRGLPTSIDVSTPAAYRIGTCSSTSQFERGTISYLIRATLTRPTSIAATSTCERKVSLVETVDIGPMVLPKPRIISLEPILKHSRKHIRSVPKVDQLVIDAGNLAVAPGPTESQVPDESASQRDSPNNSTGPPLSPVQSNFQSEASEESAVGSSSTGYIIGHLSPSKSSSNGGHETNMNGATTSKTITAKIELLKAGCLPGDSIPITISIKHTKRIKSLHGIIITLYRQGRIDSAPPLTLFSEIKGKDLERMKHEEYYPRSKTGLGGLSLTSAGSSSVFRKDLSQTLAPIMIDPITLSTVVTASLRVPEDVFPTVTGVPGEMISFRYYVEVVVDLGGKLAGQDRHLPRLGMVSLPSMTNHNGQTLGRDNGSAPILATWGGNIVNTDRVRREKSVVACLFEVIVGTTDSARMRGRGNIISEQNIEDTSRPLSAEMPPADEDAHQNDPIVATPRELLYPYDDYDLQRRQWPQSPHEQTYDYNEAEHNMPDESQVPHYSENTVPAPQVSTPEHHTEKERVRLAEQMLLPSQPPTNDGPSTSQPLAPTAPPDPDDDLYATDNYRAVAPSTEQGTAAILINRVGHTVDAALAPSAPPLDDLPPQISATTNDDKHELERRRLQAEASSPSDFPDIDDNGGEGGSGAVQQATAPVLIEEEEYGGHYSSQVFPSSGEYPDGLPRYER